MSNQFLAAIFDDFARFGRGIAPASTNSLAADSTQDPAARQRSNYRSDWMSRLLVLEQSECLIVTGSGGIQKEAFLLRTVRNATR
jgi:hypothetical protein